ncbi:MAG: hypothetical protein ABIR57_12270 [Aeromicrobium sp.]
MSMNPPPPPEPPAFGTPPAGPPPPNGVDIGETFRWAWKKFQENPATLVVGTLLLAVASGVVYFIAFLIFHGLFINSPSFDAETGTFSGGSGFFASIFVSALVSALSSIAVYVFQANLVRVSLKTVDGAKPEIGELFVFENLNKTIVTAALLAAGTFVGTILCYVPGLIFSVLAAYTIYFLVDNGKEPIDAIKSSISFVIANIGTLIIVILASVAALIVGAILCGVGLLVAIPVVILVNAHVFRTLTGGQIAA